MLRALEQCGPEGARAREFARKYWPGPIGTDADHQRAGGRNLGYLFKQGYVLRSGSRGDALHQLTDAGRRFLQEFWKHAERNAPAPAPRVRQESDDPRPELAVAGYGEGF